jgi:hypothetical protein
LPGKVLALARESATALVADGKERSLVSLVGQGATRTTQPLGEPARSLARSATPLLATCGDAMALAEFGRALLVSPDRGKSFRRVAGGVGSTALCGAALSGGAQFFAAVYRETSDESQILLVDPVLATALCVALLDSSTLHPTHDAVDRGEWAKVTRLVWHGPSQRLWAVGGFGVATIAAADFV